MRLSISIEVVICRASVRFVMLHTEVRGDVTRPRQDKTGGFTGADRVVQNAWWVVCARACACFYRLPF